MNRKRKQQATTRPEPTGPVIPGSLLHRLLTRVAQAVARRLSADNNVLTSDEAGLRSPSAVKSVVLDLRRKLRRQGLDDLAAAVDGSNRGYYVLRLPLR